MGVHAYIIRLLSEINIMLAWKISLFQQLLAKSYIKKVVG